MENRLPTLRKVESAGSLPSISSLLNGPVELGRRDEQDGTWQKKVRR